MHDLDLLLSEAQDAAAAMLNAMGSVAPMVMFITPAASPGACKVKGKYMGALGYQPSPNFEERLQTVSQIGGYLRSLNATAYAHLAECWVSLKSRSRSCIFITRTKRGQWYGRLASEYAVTDKPVNGAIPTHSWKNWRPEKTDSRFCNGTIGTPDGSTTEPKDARRFHHRTRQGHFEG